MTTFGNFIAAIAALFSFDKAPENININTSNAQSYSISETLQVDSTIIIDSVVEHHKYEASIRDSLAYVNLENKIKNIYTNTNGKFKNSIDSASKELSTLKSSGIVIYNMAYDKIKKSNKSEMYFNTKVSPYINPLMEEFNQEMNTCNLQPKSVPL